jgi:hypothetical protein
MIFDYQNKLFCMSKNLGKTVFETGQLKSFTIKEDKVLLFEGSMAGIKRYTSTVQERAMAIAPQISQFMMNRQMSRTLDKLDGGKANGSAPIQVFNVSEPFRAFNLELHFEHPYWKVIKCGMSGPRFDNTHPDVNNYLRDYRRSMEEIEKLVAALRTVTFPDATEQSVSLGAAGTQAIHTTMPSLADVIEEIKKYKALLKDGIISQQEYDAKRRQLLGI